MVPTWPFSGRCFYLDFLEIFLRTCCILRDQGIVRRFPKFIHMFINRGENLSFFGHLHLVIYIFPPINPVTISRPLSPLCPVRLIYSARRAVGRGRRDMGLSQKRKGEG